MNLKEYQELAMRTNDRMSEKRMFNFYNSEGLAGQIIDACLGLSGEVGEVNDIIKKTIFHGHDLDQDELKKEVGDIMWYIALMCDALDTDMEEIAKMNIEKLKKRYPDGFSEQASKNRSE